MIAAAGSAVLLGGAHLFERVGGYPPCELCLDQREAHWTALAIALAGLGATLAINARRAAAAAVGACALVFLISAGLAFFHTGVEFKFWPGPASCAGGGGAGVTDAGSLAGALNAGASGPSCADAPWRLFGISMAGYNLLFSAALFAICLIAAIDATRRAQADLRRPHRPSQPTSPATSRKG